MYNQAGSQNAEGGFFNDTSMYSPSVNSDRKRDVVRKQQSIASATIKQLMDCPGDTLMIGGHEITLIKLMVKVKSIDVTSIKTEYILEDDTGNITGVSWRDGETADETAETAPVVENTYCQVVGSLRSAEDSKTLLVLHIAPVTNPNLITEHLLSIMHTKLKAQVGTAAPTGEATATSTSTATNGGTTFNGAGNPNQTVLNYITVVGGPIETGISKHQIIGNFDGQFTAKKVDEILNYLCTEGQIYTTTDDDHFKSTE